VIDLHCHLDLYKEPIAIAKECEKRRLYVLSITTTPSAWTGTSALVAGSKRIQTALGLHPQLVHERKGELALFERLLPDARYVGEIGLDGGPEYKAHWKDQVEVFSRILELCSSSGGRVLSIHSRRAAPAVLDHLENTPAAGKPILHWFSGSANELARAVELGCWFSVGPTMLNSVKGRNLVSLMPRNRVLTETDGPFAKIEGRAAFPWDVFIAIERLSEIWSISKPDTEHSLRENLRCLVS
jgi:TatD DNase family protein